jgi:N-acetylglucosamine-6-phosphate deacetylase
MAFALTGSKTFDGDALRSGLAVVIDGPHIVDLVEEYKLPDGAARHRLKGGVLAPGFIDVQVNGGGGALLNAEPTVEGVKRIAASHRRFGTTGLLPTVITDAPEVMSDAIAAVRVARTAGVPGILGIHVEGPFLDPGRKGAHDARFIRKMTKADIAPLTSADCGVVMITVAPNKVRPELIKALADAGILVSLGHSEATATEAYAALQAGARAFTHLFNSMSQLEPRAAGMVGAGLADRESYCGIIADGFHVDETALQVVMAAKPRDRIMLITDAMPTAAGGPSSFELQGRRVLRVDGRLQLDDGTLAGSNVTMDETVRHCVNRLKLPLEDALRMASRNPAAFLKRDRDLGRIAPGYLASLVHLSDDLQVLQTWIEGT